jgi:hypothetical protein
VEQAGKGVAKRVQYLCQRHDFDGRRLPTTEVDHRIPTLQGATDAPPTLFAINEDCHKLKTAAESQEISLVREAARLRERAIRRSGSAELLRHGDWHLDRALFARKNMYERGISELISRVFVS